MNQSKLLFYYSILATCLKINKWLFYNICMHGRYKKKRIHIVYASEVNRWISFCPMYYENKIKGKKRNKRIITQLSEERKQEIRAKINLSHRTHQSYG